jgi:hypothetical protein
VSGTASVDDAFELLAAGAPALVAVAEEQPLGVITKLDLLEYLARAGRRT